MQLKLGESIRSRRKKMGLTQEQLAEALGVTTGAVHKWESGKTTPELTMLVQIAQFFETSIDELLGYGWENGTMGQLQNRSPPIEMAAILKRAFALLSTPCKNIPTALPLSTKVPCCISCP